MTIQLLINEAREQDKDWYALDNLGKDAIARVVFVRLKETAEYLGLPIAPLEYWEKNIHHIWTEF